LGKRRRAAGILVLVTAAVAVLLWYSLKGARVKEIGDAFAAARYGYALPAVLALAGVFVVKALRWRVLLAPLGKVPFLRLLSAIMIGFMANCIISRIGEVVRAVALGAKTETRTSTALATIAVERVFDMATVILFLAIGMVGVTASASDGEAAARFMELRAAGVTLGVLLAVGVVILILFRVWPERMKRVALGCTAWLPGMIRSRVKGFIESFLPGLQVLRSLPQVAAIAGLSVVHWFLQVIMFQIASHCLAGVSACFPLTFPESCLVFAFTALAVAALPLPGFVGIFQGGVTGAMTVIFGAPDAAMKSAWVTYAWLSWLVNIPPIIAGGFVFLWVEGLNLRALRQRGRGANDE